MNYCYIRVSTDKQEYDRQFHILNQHGYKEDNCTFLTETYSGKSMLNRPVLNELLSIIEKDDVIIVESLSRLARSTKDLLEICEILEKKEASLISIKENIDMTSPIGKFFITVMGAINQLERDNTAERTREALKVKKMQGIQLGRPREVKNLDPAIKAVMSKKMSITEASKKYNVVRSTLYYHIGRIKKGEASA